MPQNRIPKRWDLADIIPPEIDDALAEYPPLLRKLLYNRQITDSASARQFLTATGPLHDPFLLTDMQKAVARICQAIDEREEVVIYGDYDVDGVTATALLVQVIRCLGCNAQGYIPNRFDEGYGVNNEALDSLAEHGTKLIVTVDCGIRSPREVEHARELGMDIIISDHHEPKGDLPHAVAVINPKRPGDAYPEKNLSGVGLAFKISEALVSHRQANLKLDSWLDLVAVGTVSDIVPLLGENRSMVKAGLSQMRKGMRQGLRSLAGAANLQLAKVTARDIGFVLGPRLNASGRLETAEAAYELMMTEDADRASILAQKLDDLNRQRQEKTLEIQKKAAELVKTDADIYLLFAVHPDFNLGLIGLAASRLVESSYLPAIVGVQEEEFTRCSCRSIPEFHITQALDACSNLLERHGGHAMAAGFTVLNKNLPELTARLQEIARRQLSGQELTPSIKVDARLSLKELHPEILKYLEALDPTGMGNPEGLFMSTNLKVLRHRIIGSDRSHLRITVNESGVTFDGIAFRQAHHAENGLTTVDLVYSYETNEYNGVTSLQLNVRDLRATPESVISKS
jgi:single-stranded-DNA-specific exonuclease